MSRKEDRMFDEINKTIADFYAAADKFIETQRARLEAEEDNLKDKKD